MFHIPLDKITDQTILSLIGNSLAAEGPLIEYKRQLPAKQDPDRRDFLRDVSAFANGAGGDLVYGLEEEKGIPTNIVGLMNLDPDADVVRLVQLVNTGIIPRFSGCVPWVVTVDGKSVLVLRISKSWNGPHLVSGDNSNFWVRGHATRSPMTYDEIRSAFRFSERFPDQVRQWRDDRVERILAGKTPGVLAAGAKMVLHMIPLTAFNEPYRIAATALERKVIQFGPFEYRVADHRINLDGLLIRTNGRKDSQGDVWGGYTQAYRSGCIEVVGADHGSIHDSRKYVWHWLNEKQVMETVARLLRSLGEVGIEPPITVMLSLLDVAGGYPWIDGDWSHLEEIHPVDRDNLLLQEVVIEQSPQNLPLLLRPVFDAMWNAVGRTSSPNFDATGRWLKGKLKDVPGAP